MKTKDQIEELAESKYLDLNERQSFIEGCKISNVTIERKIQEAKNKRQEIKNDIAEKRTVLRVREAEALVIEYFIDQLNSL